MQLLGTFLCRKPAVGSGALPNSQMLDKAGISVDNSERMAAETGKQGKDETSLGAGSVTSADKKAGEKPQLFLAASGLPTVPQRLAQRIWDLDFIEMEEFLPSNKTVQALEVSRLGGDSLPSTAESQSD